MPNFMNYIYIYTHHILYMRKPCDRVTTRQQNKLTHLNITCNKNALVFVCQGLKDIQKLLINQLF